MTPEDRLVAAAKRVQRYLAAQVAGTIGTLAAGDHEDLHAGRELAAAIAAVEAARTIPTGAAS